MRWHPVAFFSRKLQGSSGMQNYTYPDKNSPEFEKQAIPGRGQMGLTVREKETYAFTYEFTGLLPAKTRTDQNGPANAQAPAMIQLLPRSNPEFTISPGFCIEMCGMFILVAIAQRRQTISGTNQIFDNYCN